MAYTQLLVLSLRQVRCRAGVANIGRVAVVSIVPSAPLISTPAFACLGTAGEHVAAGTIAGPNLQKRRAKVSRADQSFMGSQKLIVPSPKCAKCRFAERVQLQIVTTRPFPWLCIPELAGNSDVRCRLEIRKRISGSEKSRSCRHSLGVAAARSRVSKALQGIEQEGTVRCGSLPAEVGTDVSQLIRESRSTNRLFSGRLRPCRPC
ncbi:hypothetical protein ACVW1C_006053 [Bradyrhizobium sp. USDA 4011]